MNWRILAILLIITSCQTNKEVDQPNKKTIGEHSPKVPQTYICDIRDTTITHQGFHYTISRINEEEYEISWGDSVTKRKYPEKFICLKKEENEICDFTPSLELMTNEKILLRVATATPNASNCSPIEYKLIYLPKAKNKEPFEIDFHLKTIDDYAIYSNSLDSIFLMNFTTRQVQSIELSPKPYFIFKAIDFSIDSINIIDNELFFRYLIGTHEEHHLTERKVKLEV